MAEAVPLVWCRICRHLQDGTLTFGREGILLLLSSAGHRDKPDMAMRHTQSRLPSFPQRRCYDCALMPDLVTYDSPRAGRDEDKNDAISIGTTP